MGLTERAWTQYQACRDADEIMVQTAIQTPDTNDPVLVNLTLTDAVYLLKHHAERITVLIHLGNKRVAAVVNRQDAPTAAGDLAVHMLRAEATCP